MKPLRYALLLSLLLHLLPAFAQWNERQYAFRTLDINDGLSQNTVHAILQDRLGFLWFGTKDGLNRYDGITFQLFRKERGNLGNNFITALHEDRRGLIWIGTDAGVYIYHPTTEKIEHFEKKSDKGTVVHRSVTVIESDRNGGVWIAADGQGIFYYDPKNERLENFLVDKARQTIPQNVTRFFFDANDVCWIALYGDNLYYTKDKFRTLTRFTTHDGRQPFKDDIIGKIVAGTHNCLYVGSANAGLQEINLTSRSVRQLLLNDERGENVYVRELAFYSENELWVGSESGLFIYHLSTDKYIHVQNIDADPYSLADNAIYSLCKDKEGGMWIGSYFGGVNYYPKPYTYFEKIYPRKGLDEMGKRVREFCSDKEGTLWIGTEDKGLFRYDRQTGAITPFKNPLLYHNIHALAANDRYLWVGTFSKGLNRIDLHTHTVKNYQKGEAPNALNANDIFTLCRTTTGELWIGTTSGLLRYNPATDDFTRHKELEGIFIYDIKEDVEGNIWLATYVNGVYRRSIHDKRWKHFTYHKEEPRSLSYDKVLSIFEDSRHQLWFTTQGGGFCRFDPATETFDRYDSTTKGLPSNVIYRMIEDNKGTFWITTNKGLLHFDPTEETFKVYTVGHGLLSDQFNYQSGYKDPNGRIYLGSINGFITFDPSTFEKNAFIPPVVITDFTIFTKKVAVGTEDSPLKQSITLSDEVKLSYGQNSFALSIAALSYQAPDMNRLMYKLDGYDPEWYVAGNVPISYSNLPYGSYTFMVKGSNSDGVWNEQPRTLKITIRPPFYLAIGAYAVYLLLFACATVGLVAYLKRRATNKHRRQMEKFEQEKERELYTAKFDFFTNVAHEIRTPLTLIKSPLESVLRETEIPPSIKDDLLIMDQNAERLLNLTNQLLDFRKTEGNGLKLNLVECNLIDVLHRVYVRFTTLAKQKGLELSIEQPEEELLTSVDREALTKIISNLINNAVKYGKTYVHVNLFAREESGEFCLVVSNDGQAIPTEMREEIFQPFVRYKAEGYAPTLGTGIGLALSRSLAELHKGSLRMDDALECNRFILTIPIDHQAATAIDPEMEEEAHLPQHEPTIGIPPVEGAIQAKRGTLLIVEDNPEMLTFLSRQLSPLYVIRTANDGLEALKVLKEEYIHLIVSDVMMPHMNGMELCYRVKSDLDYSHIPLILLTAKTTIESKIEGLHMGADAYVEKPFSVEYLRANIATLLSNRDKIREAFNSSPFITSNTMALTKADEEFLKTLHDIVVSNMHETDFSLDHVATEIGMSRSSLYRKIKGLIDMTPNDYIRVERLKRAAELLAEREYKVNEICYMVGFSTSSYFAKCFQKQFGVLPRDFVAEE